MAHTLDQPVAFGVPRVPPGAIDRPRLEALLDKRAPLTVIRGAGGRGKTTLVSQWLAKSRGESEAVVWIDLEPVWRYGEDPWLRVIEALGNAGVLRAAEVARNLTVMGSSSHQIAAMVRRIFTSLPASVLVVLDGVPAPDEPGVTQWVHQTVELLSASAQLRCIVMSQSDQLFAGPLVRSQIEMVTIDDHQLALTEDEAAHMIAAHDHAVDEDGKAVLIDLTTGATAAELRYLLALVDTPGVDLATLARGEVSADVAAMVRRDVLHTAANDAGWTFMGLISFAATVTPSLAVELTGDPQAEDILDAWVRAGMGHWTTLPHVGKAFRLVDVLRSSASADLLRDYPAQAQQAQSKTALWLLDEAHDPKAALREALDADDLELVERAFMNSFAFTAPDGERALPWLANIPAHRIHRHPFLALYRALQLNADAKTRLRAVEYFAAATLVGKFKSTRVEPLEQAFRISLEGTTWRVLGRESTMVARARKAIELVQNVREARPDEWAPAITLWAIQQAMTSLLCAGLTDEANSAIDLLEHEAAAQDSCHFVALARGARALVQVTRGEVAAARETLATISEDAWPEATTWKNGYMQALHILALAWVDLHDGKPAQALRTIARLDAHADTIEFWDKLLEVRVFALIMVGRRHEAEYVYRQTRAEREERRTLSLARARLNFIAQFLSLTGAVISTPGKHVSLPALRSLERAVAAMTAMGAGRPDRALSALLEAELTALSVRDNVIAAVAGVVVGHGASQPQVLERNAARLATLTHQHSVFLPTALLTAPEREAALQALDGAQGQVDPSLRDQLANAFSTITALTTHERSTVTQIPELTPSEHELLVLLATGLTRDELAKERFVSVNTIKTQLRSLYAKLGVKSRDDAVNTAVAMGMLTAEEIPSGD